MLSNLFGTAILFVANSWVTFMISPAGIDESGALKGGVWAAINNFTWMPINIHRLIANVVFGGTIAAPTPRFGSSPPRPTRSARATTGWATSAISSPSRPSSCLPFAGYWLGREIYAYNQTMGITMMGGFMSWLWIIQAILIGILFLGSNYYLWLGMERIPGAERYRKYVPPMLIILTIGFMVWATPRSMVVTLDEARAMGGTHHPLLGFFGVMSAKNTVVNLMILTTFLSYILYRRANKIPTTPWVKTGMAIQWAAFGAAALVVVFYGIYGYFVESIVRIGFSVYQVRRGDRRHRGGHGPRRADVQGRALHRRDPLGHHRAALAVRADLARGDLHLAHGADGLRALGHPPALARVRRAARHLGRGGHAPLWATRPT